MAYLAIYFEVWLISYCFIFLQVWDANVLTKPVENFNLSRKIYCHHISPLNPTRVAVATDSNHIRLVDLRSGSSSHELRSHTGNVITVKWAPHGSSILASGMYCIYYIYCPFLVPAKVFFVKLISRNLHMYLFWVNSIVYFRYPNKWLCYGL